jgi:DNA topoisomerase-1
MKTAALLDLPPVAPIRDPVAEARAQGLRYVTDARPGFSRRRYGKAFVFFDQRGERIRDEKIIARIRALAIPPAWREVWICPHANGHLQATGFDAKDRKQYRYHADWRALREGDKFGHMVAFAETLPAIRAQVSVHMAQRRLTREKVLASVVALLERTLIRVGNDEYARRNRSYGLTTLLSEHVEISGQTLRFRFTGKSGKAWNLKLSDRRIARVVRACAEIEGQELFKYIDEEGAVHDVTSGDVNAYLREISGADVTAKDFRTWNGTVLATCELLECGPCESAAHGKRQVSQAMKAVAARLGNTPAVCRKSYVHPQVVKAYLNGNLAMDDTLQADAQATGLTAAERQVLAFLRQPLSPRA